MFVALALVVRLGVVAGAARDAPSGDAADYDRHAAALVAVGTYPQTLLAAPGGPTALRPPAYPYALAAAYRVTGGRWTAGRLLGALLGTVSVALAALIAFELFGPRVARWTAGLAAFFAPLAYLSGSLLSENLFVPAVLGALAAVLALRRTGALGWALAAGALCGLAAVTRSNGIVVALPVALGAWAVAGRRARAAALVVAGTLVLLAPWVARNVTAFDGRAPLGTQTGYTLAGMYNAEAYQPGNLLAVWRTPDTVAGLRSLFHRPCEDEAAVDGALRSRALRFAARHPGYVGEAIGLGALRLFDLGPGHAGVSATSYGELGIPESARALLRAELYAAIALALAGAVVLTRRRAWGPGWVWLAAALLALSVLPTSGVPRYRAPLDPFLMMLAAVAVVAWRERRAAR